MIQPSSAALEKAKEKHSERGEDLTKTLDLAHLYLKAEQFDQARNILEPLTKIEPKPNDPRGLTLSLARSLFQRIKLLEKDR